MIEERFVFKYVWIDTCGTKCTGVIPVIQKNGSSLHGSSLHGSSLHRLSLHRLSLHGSKFTRIQFLSVGFLIWDVGFLLKWSFIYTPSCSFFGWSLGFYIPVVGVLVMLVPKRSFFAMVFSKLSAISLFLYIALLLNLHNFASHQYIVRRNV